MDGPHAIAGDRAIDAAWVLTIDGDLQDTTTGDLPTAPTRRSVIDRAIGVLMCENACGSDHAARALTAAAKRQRLDVLEVAHAVLTIASGALFRLEPASYTD